MYFKASGRTNPKTKRHEGYYRLVESYRNSMGRVCHRTILNVGFLEDILTSAQLKMVARTLTDIYENQQSVFDQADVLIEKWVTRLWSRIVGEKRFEGELQKIKKALTKKGGTKTVEKVNQRIGRAKQRYPLDFDTF